MAAARARSLTRCNAGPRNLAEVEVRVRNLSPQESECGYLQRASIADRDGARGLMAGKHITTELEVKKVPQSDNQCSKRDVV